MPVCVHGCMGVFLCACACAYACVRAISLSRVFVCVLLFTHE